MCSTTICPPGTTTLWNGCGAKLPSGVTNVRSTTESVADGLNSVTSIELPLAVDPEAKYQVAAVAREQGAWDHPSGPLTDWVASTPPPAKTTWAPSQGPAFTSEGTMVNVW